LANCAGALAELDCYAGLAELVEEQSYVSPLVDDSQIFHVEGGRHPVIEQTLREMGDGPFIENDCFLGTGTDGNAKDGAGKRIWIVTGPNMAGKSTFLRQNAIIAVLAQTGSFVPARAAHIGIVDRLFCRVGASDELARGRSTFMVEMVETAGILNQSSDRSLVIIDEIGRGTATYDGLSIAWATVEYLHEVNRCRVLFATHYHELTALAQKLSYIANATIEVKEWQDEIVFLHKVISGAADRSYGIQVAKLAGLPKPVIARSAEVLRLLEAKGDSPSANDVLDELPLFAAARPRSHVPPAREQSVLDQAMEVLNPDDLTPRDALDALYKLKKLWDDADKS
ncbi:MAG: MutS-related protein, partial [Methyloligellaceae bacterium]